MGKAKRKMRITLYFNDSTDGSRVTDGTNDWIVNTENLEPDDRPGHYPMYHIVGSPLSYKALGYGQLEVFRPICNKEK